MKKNLVIGSLVVASLVQAASPALARDKDKEREIIGNIIGGVIGGAIGSQVGKGNGNTAATIIGAIAGTLIGGKVGRDMDGGDRRGLEDAQRRGLGNRLGERNDWEGRNYGSRSGARGSFTTTREGYNNRTGEYCREYVNVIYLRDRTEETRGVACTRRDGSWYEVTETEVRFSGGGRGYGPGRGDYGPGRGDGYGPGRGPDRGGPFRPPVPPPPPIQSRYEGTVQLSQVSRRGGGEWLRVTLRRPVSVESIQIRALSAGVRIHEGSVYTESGRRVQIREFSPTGTFYAGATAVSERLNSGERVQVIDIRAESMGGFADLLVKVISDEQTPALSASRF